VTRTLGSPDSTSDTPDLVSEGERQCDDASKRLQDQASGPRIDVGADVEHDVPAGVEFSEELKWGRQGLAS
jgi:hypothetical protein